MGGKAGKIILPLVAIAATVATGPSGLGLWGASAPAVAAASALPALPAAINVGLAPGVILPQVAEQSFFSSLFSSVSELSGAQKIGFGLQAVQAGGKIFSSDVNAAGQRAAIAFQENQLKLKQSEDRLNISNNQLESQRRLRRTLSTQNNFFAAVGVNQAQGSAARLADAAIGEQSLESSLLNTRSGLNEFAAQNRFAALNFRRRSIGSGGATFGSLLDFGGAFASTVDSNRRLGRA